MKGFTLIELLVVIALIAVISVFAVPTVTGFFKVSLNSATRELASKVKEAYNSSAVTGRVYRIVYDLKEQQWWVEAGSTSGGELLDTKESLAKEERRKRFAKLSDAPPPSSFNLDKLITRKKIALPTGVTFEDVITQQSPDPVITGQTFTHFFPQGLTEQTIIHLKDGSQHHVSLVISPLIGKTDLYERYMKGDEVFGK